MQTKAWNEIVTERELNLYQLICCKIVQLHVIVFSQGAHSCGKRALAIPV